MSQPVQNASQDQQSLQMVALDGAQPTVIPHLSTSVIIGQPMGTKPSVTTCKTCKYEIVTRIEKKATTKTHVIAFLLCLFLCWPCVCLPYCMSSCNNIDHYCTKCNSYIGSYHLSLT
ncbi:lipopolysaccharide-induced tumor necrosis factor-alpha factor homolog [Anticarsia gemmatalis]|uniref:lipopolysaccharide-induced tumor necrosis factor-alpha factor homolog n=1 Tax=Anticarsia gemmatalis TaxID=129554 RepID=UPI003F774250